MDGKPLLAYNIWLALPSETRLKLARLFDIPRTGQVVVHTGGIVAGNIGGVVSQDGHSAGDLYAITVEKMQKFLDTDDTDFYKMFNHIVENIDYIIEPGALVREDTGEKIKSEFGPTIDQAKKLGVKQSDSVEDEDVDPKDKKNFAKLMKKDGKKKQK